MPRAARTEMAGAIHHVWQRGNNRRRIFFQTGDRAFFLSLLSEVAAKYEWQCLGYCLMENHFHLVVETPRCTLGSGMRDLGSRYAQWFNALHATGGGHFFQARFGSKPVCRDEQFAQLTRYVARNPVRAGLCRRPEDWRWSSHRGLLRGNPHPLVAVDRVTARLEALNTFYARLFEFDGPLAGIDPDLSPWQMRPPLAELLAGADPAAALSSARREGYRLAEIATHLGVSESTVSRRLRRAA